MKEYDKNPRKISDAQLQDMKTWLRELGDLSGVVHDLNSDQIIGGNQRSKVFDINKCRIEIEHKLRRPDSQGTIAHGYVIWQGKRYSYRQVRWTKKQCEKANIIANRAGGEWDNEQLKKFFKNADLSDWGFNEDELTALFGISSKALKDAPARFDQADKLLKKWKVKCGDLWMMGDHRLVCGDSSDPAVVEKLMAGKIAALFSTDPPYMVDYDGTARPGGGTDWSDKYRESPIDDKQQFLINVFQAWQRYLQQNAAWFVWHASAAAGMFQTALVHAGILVHQVIIWVKPIFVIGFAVYNYRHEPCFFGWKKGNKPYTRPGFFDGKETTVWDQTKWLEHQEEILVELHDRSSVWLIDWQGKKRQTKSLHPTEKPIEIFARPMRNHTKPGDICAEPFCGSGSQILAGQQEGRIVYACEIEPAFVAVALQRFEDATGITPRKAGK